ncbi:autotransporter outer membrane beta-barrel domain-containing protein [Bradyrhizobium iriomotense]|uniref:autotransporter outer membrane beta-barrel domain-containing protein n=1 Tax=Bradyrhizobium iriomotense TaxID=441950 RepID=UPI001B8A7C7B|nr:autotransporter domain-containing protein [Bradyrhizobium iriomotense]MBR0785015.1 autotransporter domain-containing protein [Bradyrhizobium iriomotense]
MRARSFWLAAALSLAAASPAVAQATRGGDGGSSSTSFANGGTSSATGTGGDGGDAPLGTRGAGGGGAGVTGGAGGTDSTGTIGGGAGGAGPGDNGRNGNNGDSSHGGGGGGGGAHGAVVTTDTTNAATIAGGTGGRGGSTTGNFAAGGGGAGGYGVVVNGSGLAYTNTGTVNGGTGGNGGAATTGNGFAGDGGDGGYGIFLTGSGVLTNAGSIAGGNGGNGGNAPISNQTSAAGDGGNGGAGVYFAGGGTLINSGSIIGGDAGSAGTASSSATHGSDGLGGAGVVGADLTIINSGSISGGWNDGSTRANAITFTGGSNVLELWAGSAITGNVVGTGTDTFRLGGSTDSTFDVSSIGASAQYQGFSSFVKTGSSTWTLTGTTTAVTPWTINQGTLAVSSDASLGDASGGLSLGGGTLQVLADFASARTITLNAGGGTFDTNGYSVTLSGAIGGAGGLTKVGGGTLVLTGTSSYTGATIVNAGVLDVEGAITATSAVTVNAGATLTGSGLVDPLTVTINAGAVLAPGNGTAGSSMTIDGNLVMQSGAIYRVQLDPSSSSFATVNGTATLGGATVNAVFANGSYVSKTYTILTASGGVSGSFAPDVVNTNLPSNFHTTLSYDTKDVYLNLVLDFAVPGGLNGNQQAVGNALTGFFNRTGGIPAVYGALTPAGLTQASGETGTGVQQTTFNAMGRFVGLLTDPATHGAAGANAATGFADEDRAARRTDAFAMLADSPPRNFEQRWNVWAAGLGGSQSTSGNGAVGSNDATSRTYATAVGAEHWLSPRTVAGFALAGGGTSFGINNLGSGRSDLFQAGIYLRHADGPAFITAALAYGWQDITTDRTMTISGVDRLRANFKANAWAGRVEGGYRFVAPINGGIGLTPYAAAQAALFDQPAYIEQAVSGTSAFALSYAGKRVTDGRSELGLRSDKSFAMQDGILTLRGRLAWTHDFNPDRTAAASFVVLPGASFAVTGAAQARDSALTTTSVEMRWASGWSAVATFEGEFSALTRAYAGKGAVRYAW